MECYITRVQVFGLNSVLQAYEGLIIIEKIILLRVWSGYKFVWIDRKTRRLKWDPYGIPHLPTTSDIFVTSTKID